MRKKLTVFLFISLLLLIAAVGCATVYTSKQKAEEVEAQKARMEQELLEKEQEEKELPVEISDSPETEEYTFTDMEKTMYIAENGTEIRDAADNDGEIINTYSVDTAVAVVGQCDQTKYYKIKINGDYGYVAEEGLSAEYVSIPLPISGEVTVPSATKDILFIGNSITCYPKTDDWWGGGWGCGATRRELDYVHLTVAAKGYSSYDAMSMRKWEFSSTRNNELKELDNYIKNYQYGTIVIELGENANGKTAHLKEDFVDMMKYIKTYNPNARLVMLDNFWKFDGVISAKKAAASECGATYVGMSDLWGVKDYQLQSGDVIADPADPTGETVYTINDFLAGHPNDAGFAAIANHLIGAL